MIIKTIIGRMLAKMEWKINAYKAAYYKSIISKENIHISGDTHIIHPQNIFMGDGSFINGGGTIAASPNAKIKMYP